MPRANPEQIRHSQWMHKTIARIRAKVVNIMNLIAEQSL
jgi:hypothetical protein